jgi:hypothetical protein
MNLQAMLNTYPAVRGDADELVVRATEACFDCAQICVACADACLSEKSVAGLRGCVLYGWTCWNAADKLRRIHRWGDVRSLRRSVPPLW